MSYLVSVPCAACPRCHRSFDRVELDSLPALEWDYQGETSTHRQCRCGGGVFDYGDPLELLDPDDYARHWGRDDPRLRTHRYRIAPRWRELAVIGAMVWFVVWLVLRAASVPATVAAFAAVPPACVLLMAWVRAYQPRRVT